MVRNGDSTWEMSFVDLERSTMTDCRMTVRVPRIGERPSTGPLGAAGDDVEDDTEQQAKRQSENFSSALLRVNKTSLSLALHVYQR